MGRIIVRRYRIPLPEQLAKPTRPVRAVLIGDLHGKMFGEANKDLVMAIEKEVPDVIFSVGDLAVCKPGKETKAEVGIALLKRLSCICPVYAILGNHELRTREYAKAYPGVYDHIRNELRKSGVTLLENDQDRLKLLGTEFCIHGMDIPMKYYKKLSTPVLTAEEIRHSIGEPEKDCYNVLLAHHPVFFESYALWGADLTLSGHLHGGMVRLPILGGAVSPQLKLFPKYDCGLYRKYGHHLAVTAGLGWHSIAFRINNPPEITSMELY
ncbi:MAG: metallophosphoesterase [Eubacteriales bacterium]|nr:metallophosphoesterase [Eubacteriales bacterium]